MDKLPDPVVYAVPAFILLLIVEMVVSLRRDKSRYEARDTLTSLMLGTVSQVAGALVGAAVVGMSVWVYQFHLFDIGLAFRQWWWAWILCFFLELCHSFILVKCHSSKTFKARIIYIECFHSYGHESTVVVMRLIELIERCCG